VYGDQGTPLVGDATTPKWASWCKRFVKRSTNFRQPKHATFAERNYATSGTLTNKRLAEPRRGPLLHRIGSAHAPVEAAAVEARRRVRLDEDLER
jgi:hypothetical protein